jgi:hypothetical protein
MPDDEEIRCFVHGKSNLTAPGNSQAYGFDETTGLVFLGPVDITLDELLDGKMNPKKQAKQPSQLDLAKQFIAAAMSNGVTSAAEIKLLAESAGISKNTLDRAKSALAINSVKQGDCWLCQLPTDNEQPQEPQETVCSPLGVLGVLESTEGGIAQ